MKTSRNDPCPCGSGKKYKACCMARDQARTHARSVLGKEVFDEAEAAWTTLAREQTVWAADVVPAPGSVREAPDGMAVAMVTAGEWVAHVEVLKHRPVGVAERARDLASAVNAAARALGVFPERVEIPYADVVPELGRQLEGRGILVAMGDSEHLADAIDATLAPMDPSPARGRLNVALAWRETEATPQGSCAIFTTRRRRSTQRRRGRWMTYPRRWSWSSMMEGIRGGPA